MRKGKESMTINDAVALRTLRLMQQREMTQYRLEQDAGIFHGAMDRILQSKNKTAYYKYSNYKLITSIHFRNKRSCYNGKRL